MTTIETLKDEVLRYTDGQKGLGPFVTGIDGFVILRSDKVKPPNHVLFRSALCAVLQGAKWAMFGDRRYDYRAGEALIVSVDVPLYGRVEEASPEEPYLGLILEFDTVLLRQVLEEMKNPPVPEKGSGPGVFVGDFDAELADCALRILRLLKNPDAIGTLYPLIMKEVYFRLLSGPYGGEVAKIAISDGATQRVMSAIRVLRERFTETLRIEDLARVADLSPSAFHRQFKALCSMTPLQYQKQLRLLEARRLLISDEANAETAALKVGYESASQFSREYSRMFGAPPHRDTKGPKPSAA